MAPTLTMFYLEMETFFAYADYSIALDYLEVVAQGKGIQTQHGRRYLRGVPQLYGDNNNKSSEPEEGASHVVYKQERPVSRYNIPVRLYRALRKYSLPQVIHIFFMRLKARFGK